MNAIQLNLFMRALAIAARIEGMKSRNQLAQIHGDHPYWNQGEFEAMAQELEQLSVEALNS